MSRRLSIKNSLRVSAPEQLAGFVAPDAGAESGGADRHSIEFSCEPFGCAAIDFVKNFSKALVGC